MIYLTNSALRYAADLCAEISDYLVIVYISRADRGDAVIGRLRTYIKNKGAAMTDLINRTEISYENGSKITVAVPGNVRGQLHHLAIVSTHLPQQTVDDIITPSYTRHNIDRSGGSGGITFDWEATPIGTTGMTGRLRFAEGGVVTDDDILNGTIGNGFVNDFTTQTGTDTITTASAAGEPFGPTTMADALETISVAANQITADALWADNTAIAIPTRATITSVNATTTNDINDVRNRIEELEIRLREEIEQRQIEREIDRTQNERGRLF